VRRGGRDIHKGADLAFEGGEWEMGGEPGCGHRLGATGRALVPIKKKQEDEGPKAEVRKTRAGNRDI